MKPQDIQQMALAAEANLVNVNLVMRAPRPASFPRGELLCVNSGGHKVYMFDPLKLLAWYRKYREAVDEKA